MNDILPNIDKIFQILDNMVLFNRSKHNILDYNTHLKQNSS